MEIVSFILSILGLFLGLIPLFWDTPFLKKIYWV